MLLFFEILFSTAGHRSDEPPVSIVMMTKEGYTKFVDFMIHFILILHQNAGKTYNSFAKYRYICFLKSADHVSDVAYVKTVVV